MERPLYQPTNNKNDSGKNKPVVSAKDNKNKPDANLRDKEDGFSIYLMGANEERIKNLRKKEQIEKIMKTRSNNNSKSIATRKKWDQIQPKSPNVIDRSKSKEIKNINSNHSNAKIETNYNNTHKIASKDMFQNHNSNNNLEEILFNMNKNVNTNLNKLDIESPGNVRTRKNWGEPKYNVMFPDSVVSNNNKQRESSLNNDFLELGKEHRTVNLHSLNNMSHKKNDNYSLNHFIKSSNTSHNSSEGGTKDKKDKVNIRYDTEEHLFQDQSIVLTQGDMCNVSPKKFNNQYKNNFMDRPFSSVLNNSESHKHPPPSTKNVVNTVNSENPNLIKEGSSKANETTKSNIQFIYNSNLENKSKSKNYRPLSHMGQKTKSVATTSSMYDRLTMRETATATNQLKKSNLDKSESKNQVAEKKKNKYPMISNIVVNNNTSQQKSSVMTPGNNTTNNKKKDLIINKIELLDEKKLNKLARVVEELSNNKYEDETGNSIFFNSKKFDESNQFNFTSNDKITSNSKKFSINYIQTDNVNFGNININMNSGSIPNMGSIEVPNLLKSSFSNMTSNLKEKSRVFENNEINEEVNYKKPNMLRTSQTLKEKVSVSSNPSTTNYSVLSLVVHSTWGNNDKVGLTEVQIFDKKNKKIDILECHVFNGSDEGILKIYNGKFHTVDEGEMWTSNFTNSLKIEIYFEATHDVDWMLLWNFNGKDTSKGVKEVEILRRNNFIWKGILNKGTFNSKSDYSTRIVLNSIIINDKYSFDIGDIDILSKDSLTRLGSNSNFNKSSNSKDDPFRKSNSSIKPSDKFENVLENNIFKELTYEVGDLMKSSTSKSNRLIDSLEVSSQFKLKDNGNSAKDINTDKPQTQPKQISRLKISSNNSKESLTNKLNSCINLKLLLTSNWGDFQYIGLTGIQFFDENNELINLEHANSILAYPKDCNTELNIPSDPRIFENIFNNVNEINDEQYMWLTLFNPSQPPFIEIIFNKVTVISAIKIWNYNKQDELYRCTKTIDIVLDDNYANQQRIILRKGVGEEVFDYSQTFSLPIKQFKLSEEELAPFSNFQPAHLWLKQDYETPYLPTGFVYKFQFISNWGEYENIGLNNIVLYDQLNRVVYDYITPKIVSYPSCNENEDTKLQSVLSNINNNKKISSWSTNYINKNISQSEGVQPVTLYLVFDRPVTVSKILLANYTINPTVGVKDFVLFCDDSIIYQGVLEKAHKNTNINYILFSSNSLVVKGLEDQQFKGNNQKQYKLTVKETSYSAVFEEN